MIHGPFDIESANLSYLCPKCKQKVRGIPLTPPQYHISAFDDNPWIIVRCPTRLCRLSFMIYDRLNDRVSQIFPASGNEPDDYHSAIPEHIRCDLAEADRCLDVQAYKGALTMLRRAVQNLVIDNLENKSLKDKMLWEQIDALFSAGLITKHLKETAHEIRHFGNFGAHPSEDGLDNTTRDDALAVDRLTNDLMVSIYITPHETMKLKEKRESSKAK